MTAILATKRRSPQQQPERADKQVALDMVPSSYRSGFLKEKASRSKKEPRQRRDPESIRRKRRKRIPLLQVTLLHFGVLVSVGTSTSLFRASSWVYLGSV